MPADEAHTDQVNTATPNQISFYNSLLDQIVRLDTAGEFSAEIVSASRDQFPTRTVDNASISIDRAKNTLARLKAAAPVAVAPVASQAVADGHYALVSADGTVKFYEVNSPTEGKWAGRTFVAAQASDERHSIKNPAARSAILAAIAADPKAAMLRYGVELGRCGHCNRTLTSEWRKLGIGPVCARKMGY